MSKISGPFPGYTHPRSIYVIGRKIGLLITDNYFFGRENVEHHGTEVRWVFLHE